MSTNNTTKRGICPVCHKPYEWEGKERPFTCGELWCKWKSSDRRKWQHIITFPEKYDKETVEQVHMFVKEDIEALYG